jgi:hypothetical protein
MAYGISLQVKTVAPSQLYPYPKNLFVQQTLPRKGVETKYTKLSSVNAGLLQGSALEPLLYLIYTADLPNFPECSTTTFADDTAVIATDSDPAIASHTLQTNPLAIQNWFKKWRMKANESKSIHVTFTTRKEACPLVHINNVQHPPRRR